MPDRFTRTLPAVAVVGLVLALVFFVLGTGVRSRTLLDTGETRAPVERAVQKVVSLQPSSLDDPAFREAVSDLQRAPYVATVWLFSPDGRIVHAAGSTAASAAAGNVVDLATAEGRRVAESLAGVLSDDQRRLVLAASTIQREGEHNDVYRHLVRVIRGRDGAATAIVGIAYDVSPALARPVSIGYAASVLAFFAGIAAYWFSLPLWVFLDGRARGERAAVWAGFVLVGNLVALAAYLLTRAPRRTVEA